MEDALSGGVSRAVAGLKRHATCRFHQAIIMNPTPVLGFDGGRFMYRFHHGHRPE